MTLHWSLRKYWWSWTKQAILKKYYNLRYGFSYETFGSNSTMLPRMEGNSFFDIEKKGNYFELYWKESDCMIRLIPATSHFGFMVECYKEGKQISRGHIPFEELWKFGYGNTETLSPKK